MGEEIEMRTKIRCAWILGLCRWACWLRGEVCELGLGVLVWSNEKSFAILRRDMYRTQHLTPLHTQTTTTIPRARRHASPTGRHSRHPTRARNPSHLEPPSRRSFVATLTSSPLSVAARNASPRSPVDTCRPGYPI